MEQARLVAREVLSLVQSELTAPGAENGVGYTLPDGKYHIFIYMDEADDTVYVIEPNRVEGGCHEPVGRDTYLAKVGDMPDLMLGCLWCLEQFESDRKNPELVSVLVYKDTLGYYDEEDNLAEILVPKQWLKEVLRAEEQLPYSQWADAYTADDTEGVAAKALNDRVIQGCTGIDLLTDGAKVEWHHDLYEVVGIYDGKVYLQHVNNDAHAEVAIERFVKDAELVSEAQISKSTLDVQIAAAAAKGDVKPVSANEPDRDYIRD